MAGGNNAMGSGVVVLTTSADGLASGLSKAQGDLTKFGQTAGHGLSQGLAGAAGGSGGGGILGMLGLAKFAGPAGLALTAGTAIGGSLVSGFETAVHKLDALGKTNKRADVLGVSASDLQGMDKLFAKVGVEADQVNGILAKMGKNILTSHGAAEVLSKMGIAPADIKDKSLTEQFKLIAEGISKLPKGAEQATAAMTLFGKSGATLLPMLQRGSAGINEFIENQKKFGGVLSDSQLKAAGDASKAWKLAKESISTAWEGLINRVVVIAAPIVKFVANAVSKGFALLAPMFEWVGRAAETVGDIATAVFDVMGEAVEEVIGLFKGWAGQIGVVADKFPTIREVIIRAFRAIGTAGGYAFDVIVKGVGNVAIGVGMLVEGFGFLIKQFKDIVSIMKDLPDNLKPAGLDKFIEGVEKLELGTKGVGKQIGEWGQKQADRRFGQGADDFNKWLDRALAPKPPKPKVPGKADGPDAPGMNADASVWNPGKFAGAIERGSKEAYSIEMRARFGSFGAPENNVPKEQLREQKNTNMKFDDLLKRLDGIESKVDEAGAF